MTEEHASTPIKSIWRTFVLLAVLVNYPVLPSYADDSAILKDTGGQVVKEEYSDNPIKPCPSSPNCVSSIEQDSKRFFPPYEMKQNKEKAWITLRMILKDDPLMTIVEETDLSIHAESRSRIFGFVDDVEFWLDNEAGLIHVRSASRTGYYDFGVNRRRLSEIEQKLRDAMNIEKLNVVSYVDLNRYTGTWYEIARYPNRFQKDCYESRATYSLRDDGKISVLNECYKGSRQGKLKSANGKAWVVDTQTNARLRVSFFWPFAGDYWIIELDENYEYVVIGHPERKFLWILSRHKTMDDTLYDGILKRLETAHRYDISRIIRTSEQ